MNDVNNSKNIQISKNVINNHMYRTFSNINFFPFLINFNQSNQFFSFLISVIQNIFKNKFSKNIFKKNNFMLYKTFLINKKCYKKHK